MSPAAGYGTLRAPNAYLGGAPVKSHYELTVQLVADDDSLLDVLAAYVAASELLGEFGHARAQLPLVLTALAGQCDRYGCPACTTPWA